MRFDNSISFPRPPRSFPQIGSILGNAASPAGSEKESIDQKAFLTYFSPRNVSDGNDLGLYRASNVVRPCYC